MHLHTAAVLLIWVLAGMFACAAMIVRSATRLRAQCRPCALRALHLAIFAAVAAEAVIVAFVVLLLMGRK